MVIDPRSEKEDIVYNIQRSSYREGYCTNRERLVFLPPATPDRRCRFGLPGILVGAFEHQ